MLKLKNIVIDDKAENYLPSTSLLNAMEVAYTLKRPLLITGEPGTGKTQFAYWVADHLSKTNNFHPLPFVYNTKTSSIAQDLFYSYDAIAHFRETHGDSGKKAEDFIQLKALGLAIAHAIGRDGVGISESILDKSNITAAEGKGSVVLIDEIDKASRDFPNDLLNEIENYEFEIKEINRKVKIIEAAQKQNIIVILTSNFEKNLPDAFLRRCIYYHIDFPSKQRLYEIILRRLNLSEEDYVTIQNRISDFFYFHEFPNINKKPSTSEFIDWM
ncbi:MAG: hypothetical protein DI539_27865, partial [Flavobacterium psychrophilum]